MRAAGLTGPAHAIIADFSTARAHQRRNRFRFPGTKRLGCTVVVPMFPRVDAGVVGR
jgi:hypothetical protein